MSPNTWLFDLVTRGAIAQLPLGLFTILNESGSISHSDGRLICVLWGIFALICPIVLVFLLTEKGA
jgi:hypothetical protein